MISWTYISESRDNGTECVQEQNEMTVDAQPKGSIAAQPCQRAGVSPSSSVSNPAAC